ncbi:MAG: hypothetical protein AB7R90_10515 [Reyranellaceae bacterium]
MTAQRKASQREMARFYERRAQVNALVKHWHETHRERWEPQCELVQLEIKAAVAALAFDAVRQDPKAPRLPPFGKPRFDAMMRCLVSQLRVKRFGPLHLVTADQWRAQIETIGNELGWAWVDASRRELPLAKPASEAKAA